MTLILRKLLTSSTFAIAGALDRLRKQVVEPVFGQIKQARGMCCKDG